MIRLIMLCAATCLLIGCGAGQGAFLAALVGQGVLTWIVALLFFRGFCWLRKYDEDFAKKHGGAGRRG